MKKDYDFLCGNDFTWVKIALGNNSYHTIKIQAALARTIDFSGGLRNLNEIIIDRCPKFTRILWPESPGGIKRLKIGNSSTLTTLNLSALVNLEELSIINCKKLEEIKGLREHLKFINIQGCKLAKLDVTLCKELKNFILTTKNSTFGINFKSCKLIESALINVEGIIDHGEANNTDQKNNADFSFDHCMNLSTLKIDSKNIPTRINITECAGLKTGLFSLGEDSVITGVSTCPQLNKEFDLENKKVEIENHILKNKKNALEMPEDTDDFETIIQENEQKENKTSHLVKIQLLMKHKIHQHIHNHNKEDIKKNNISLDVKDNLIFDSPIIKTTYQSGMITTQSDNSWNKYKDLTIHGHYKLNDDQYNTYSSLQLLQQKIDLMMLNRLFTSSQFKNAYQTTSLVSGSDVENKIGVYANNSFYTSYETKAPTFLTRNPIFLPQENKKSFFSPFNKEVLQDNLIPFKKEKVAQLHLNPDDELSQNNLEKKNLLNVEIDRSLNSQDNDNLSDVNKNVVSGSLDDVASPTFLNEGTHLNKIEITDKNSQDNDNLSNVNKNVVSGSLDDVASPTFLNEGTHLNKIEITDKNSQDNDNLSDVNKNVVSGSLDDVASPTFLNEGTHLNKIEITDKNSQDNDNLSNVNKNVVSGSLDDVASPTFLNEGTHLNKIEITDKNSQDNDNLSDVNKNVVSESLDQGAPLTPTSHERTHLENIKITADNSQDKNNLVDVNKMIVSGSLVDHDAQLNLIEEGTALKTVKITAENSQANLEGTGKETVPGLANQGAPLTPTSHERTHLENIKITADNSQDKNNLVDVNKMIVSGSLVDHDAQLNLIEEGTALKTVKITAENSQANLEGTGKETVPGLANQGAPLTPTSHERTHLENIKITADNSQDKNNLVDVNKMIVSGSLVDHDAQLNLIEEGTALKTVKITAENSQANLEGTGKETVPGLANQGAPLTPTSHERTHLENIKITADNSQDKNNLVDVNKMIVSGSLVDHDAQLNLIEEGTALKTVKITAENSQANLEGTGKETVPGLANQGAPLTPTSHERTHLENIKITADNSQDKNNLVDVNKMIVSGSLVDHDAQLNLIEEGTALKTVKITAENSQANLEGTGKETVPGLANQGAPLTPTSHERTHLENIKITADNSQDKNNLVDVNKMIVSGSLVDHDAQLNLIEEGTALKTVKITAENSQANLEGTGKETVPGLANQGAPLTPTSHERTHLENIKITADNSQDKNNLVDVNKMIVSGSLVDHDAQLNLIEEGTALKTVKITAENSQANLEGTGKETVPGLANQGAPLTPTSHERTHLENIKITADNSQDKNNLVDVNKMIVSGSLVDHDAQLNLTPSHERTNLENVKITAENSQDNLIGAEKMTVSWSSNHIATLINHAYGETNLHSMEIYQNNLSIVEKIKIESQNLPTGTDAKFIKIEKIDYELPFTGALRDLKPLSMPYTNDHFIQKEKIDYEHDVSRSLKDLKPLNIPYTNDHFHFIQKTNLMEKFYRESVEKDYWDSVKKDLNSVEKTTIESSYLKSYPILSTQYEHKEAVLSAFEINKMLDKKGELLELSKALTDSIQGLVKAIYRGASNQNALENDENSTYSSTNTRMSDDELDLLAEDLSTEEIDELMGQEKDDVLNNIEAMEPYEISDDQHYLDEDLTHSSTNTDLSEDELNRLAEEFGLNIDEEINAAIDDVGKRKESTNTDDTLSNIEAMEPYETSDDQHYLDEDLTDSSMSTEISDVELFQEPSPEAKEMLLSHTTSTDDYHALNDVEPIKTERLSIDEAIEAFASVGKNYLEDDTPDPIAILRSVKKPSESLDEEMEKIKKQLESLKQNETSNEMVDDITNDELLDRLYDGTLDDEEYDELLIRLTTGVLGIETFDDVIDGLSKGILDDEKADEIFILIEKRREKSKKHDAVLNILNNIEIESMEQDDTSYDRNYFDEDLTDGSMSTKISDDELFQDLSHEVKEILLSHTKPTNDNDEKIEAMKEELDSLRNVFESLDTNTIKIDFNKFDMKYGDKLRDFFDTQVKAGFAVWQRNTNYTFNDGTQFRFTNDILRRAKKSNVDFHYEIMSNKLLAKGGGCKVKTLDGSVPLDKMTVTTVPDSSQEMTSIIKKHKNEKVVKIEEHTMQNKNYLYSFKETFDLSKRAASHLAMKEPTIVHIDSQKGYTAMTEIIENKDPTLQFDDCTSYTVMNRAPGVELQKIIDDDYAGVKVISTEVRIALSKILLDAQKVQVSDKGIIHRDIKPANIMVDLDGPIVANIIDYEAGIVTPDGSAMGTSGYFSPETVTHPMSISAKSDVYSMACVIALLWGVDISFYDQPVDQYTLNSYIPEKRIAGIFNNITGLNKHDKMIIQTTLAAMLEVDPTERLSIDEAIEAFASVGKNYLEDDTPDPIAILRSVKKPSESLDEEMEKIKKQLESLKQNETSNEMVDDITNDELLDRLYDGTLDDEEYDELLIRLTTGVLGIETFDDVIDGLSKGSLSQDKMDKVIEILEEKEYKKPTDDDGMLNDDRNLYSAGSDILQDELYENPIESLHEKEEQHVKLLEQQLESKADDKEMDDDNASESSNDKIFNDSSAIEDFSSVEKKQKHVNDNFSFFHECSSNCTGTKHLKALPHLNESLNKK